MLTQNNAKSHAITKLLCSLPQKIYVIVYYVYYPIKPHGMGYNFIKLKQCHNV